MGSRAGKQLIRKGRLRVAERAEDPQLAGEEHVGVFFGRGYQAESNTALRDRAPRPGRKGAGVAGLGRGA